MPESKMPPMHVTTRPTDALLMALAAHGQLTSAALAAWLTREGYERADTWYVSGLLTPLKRRGLVTATGTHRKKLYMLGANAPAWAWQLMQIGGKREET